MDEGIGNVKVTRKRGVSRTVVVSRMLPSAHCYWRGDGLVASDCVDAGNRRTRVAPGAVVLVDTIPSQTTGYHSHGSPLGNHSIVPAVP
jgi:hypothetical protein